MIDEIALPPIQAPPPRSPTNRLGRKIRVLVVDDSVVIRRIISRTLADDPEIEVAGFAANGLIALQKTEQLRPDVITLDIEMPEMDGLTTLRRLREASSSACVIMCSALTRRGASVVIDALLLGANDYVTKPSSIGTIDRGLSMLRDELIPKIKQFFEPNETAFAQPSMLQQSIRGPGVWPQPRFASLPCSAQVVVIGVSTGGPTALMKILPQFPASFQLPVVIVQHMPPLFTRRLAERLAKVSPFEVAEAVEGMALQPGRAILAPGDYHLRLRRSASEVAVSLDQGPRENSCRPAVDALFRSVAEVYCGGVIGVILTGMGQDGLRGVELLKGRGAYIIAQDRASSVVWGMPGAVVEAGLANAVVGLGEVVPEILRQVSR